MSMKVLLWQISIVPSYYERYIALEGSLWFREILFPKQMLVSLMALYLELAKDTVFYNIEYGKKSCFNLFM